MTRTVLSFVIANWALLSFLAAGAVAIYVKYRFGVDYFEPMLLQHAGQGEVNGKPPNKPTVPLFKSAPIIAKRLLEW